MMNNRATNLLFLRSFVFLFVIVFVLSTNSQYVNSQEFSEADEQVSIEDISSVLESPPESAMIDMPIVKLRSLDKITARTKVFEVNVGSTVKFGSLYIRVQACRKAPPVEQPESSAFLQVWQLDKQEEPVWVFSGWMFASSPGLSSMDHPIYDVWVLDCSDKAKPAATETVEEDVVVPEDVQPEAGTPE